MPGEEFRRAAHGEKRAKPTRLRASCRETGRPGSHGGTVHSWTSRGEAVRFTGRSRGARDTWGRVGRHGGPRAVRGCDRSAPRTDRSAREPSPAPRLGPTLHNTERTRALGVPYDDRRHWLPDRYR
ncbi:Hypothetical protein AA314_08300 [Archangium gephyra]|uniref:Uncharacterized protein n=1 Tax=Archangium gephyra TaxID=48 RepID=A0AAC8QFV5_9BACT|nr:Hypothetical protein AA314_08300 [Archangium gephyra]